MKRRLAQLSSEEAEAVLSELRDTLRTEGNRGLWVQFWIARTPAAPQPSGETTPLT